ncbi:Uma2 family endonuclease [Polyangium jinanense]|uniref:Uma2 family endonuclease n=1 Tax=Polyangium jinanense TaxID=2829994 RepID=A0A9X3XB22_9BACT|nr:Uma2 family endonuclease [Polyangium jinanense]MDC3959299.1 Uma2 family endonuclease [Polyangium jinanense]MDC3985708.1 Uma2 family endonuclease [Polyangium jinanense]
MGFAAEKRARATIADLDAVPSNMVGEIINGTMYAFPRPAPRHSRASSVLGGDLMGPFQRGRGGPGGWQIFDEPELLLGPAGEEDVLVPDIAGWRIERLPRLPKTARFMLAPDWVCEVLSPSTVTVDRAEKLPAYARHGVRHLWLVDPIARTLEIFVLEKGRWTLLGVHHGSALVRAEPFDAIEIELAALWAEVEEDEARAEEAPALTSAPKKAARKATAAGKKGRGRSR